MARHRNRTWVVGLFLASLAVACGGQDEGLTDEVAPLEDDAVAFPGDEGKADSITPQGDMGLLTIVLPDVPDGVTSHVPAIQYRDTDIEANVKYRLKPGTGCIQLPDEKVCGIKIEKGQHTQYVLSGILATWQSDIHRVDVGPMPHFILANHDLQRMDGADGNDVYFTLNGPQEMDIQPRVLREQAEGPSWDLAPGQVVTHAFLKDARSFVRLVPPVREAGRPQEVDDTLQYNLHWLAWVNYRYEYSEPTLVTEPGPQNAAGEYAPCSSIGECKYASFGIFNDVHFELDTEATYALYAPDRGQYLYATNNSSMGVRVNEGETHTIEGQHIDIFDAIVDDGQGGTSTYPTTYSVYGSTFKDTINKAISLNVLDDPAWREVSLKRLTSPSGLDLVPGIYHITTKFTTPEGELEKRYRCTLVTPSVAGESRCELTYEQ